MAQRRDAVNEKQANKSSKQYRDLNSDYTCNAITRLERNSLAEHYQANYKFHSILWTVVLLIYQQLCSGTMIILSNLISNSCTLYSLFQFLIFPGWFVSFLIIIIASLFVFIFYLFMSCHYSTCTMVHFCLVDIFELLTLHGKTMGVSDLRMIDTLFFYYG